MLGAPRNDAVEVRVPAAIPYQPECSKRKRHAHVFVLLAVLAGAVGCGASLSDAQAREQRSKLRALLGEPVATRDQRDQHSRTMVEVADSGALNGLNQEQLRATIGRGIACRAEICSQNGFSESDWYYEVGVAQNEEIKQLPVLIIGFDPRGRAARIWTLKTH
ncbi:MAG TPA: hypothetical protein VK509_25955 [Polyangiales bacterium]|nr:hypothetical protein [Polyangiales bacterium]